MNLFPLDIPTEMGLLGHLNICNIRISSSSFNFFFFKKPLYCFSFTFPPSVLMIGTDTFYLRIILEHY